MAKLSIAAEADERMARDLDPQADGLEAKEMLIACEATASEPPAAWDDSVSDEVLCRLARQQLRAAVAVASALAAVVGSPETTVIATLAAAVGDLTHNPLANMRGGLATDDIGVVMDCRYLAAGLAEHVAGALEAMDRRSSTDVRLQLDGLTEARADLKDILDAALWAGRAEATINSRGGRQQPSFSRT